MSTLQYIEKAYDEKARLKRESVFHTANGQLGVRGCYEEGSPEDSLTIRGTYLNGFCEKEEIRYNERLAGFPDDKQIIVNLPDAQTMRLRADGELVSCAGREDLVQTLDMQTGCTVREFGFRARGGELMLRFTRLASFTRPEIFAIECRVSSVSFSGELSVESCLDPAVSNFTCPDDPRVASGDGRMLRTLEAEADGCEMRTVCETRNSRRRVGCAVKHGDAGMKISVETASGLITAAQSYTLQPGQTAVICKYCAYHELNADYDLQKLSSVLEAAASAGFETLMAEQKAFLDGFWERSRVTVDGNPELQAQLDFSLYGMLQSAGRDGATSVAAKGLSGEGYEGHYFWDSEIYVFPFFLQTDPEAAKALLEYRFGMLGAAREHAQRLGHAKGALYPWRTITGSECSSYYPSGSAQYHINADISHAFLTYWNSTHDEGFLEECCEVLTETARLWADTGHYIDGLFRIDCVTGPDEYTCVVNNNYYTNAGAAENLIAAAELCEELEKRLGGDAYAAFAGRLALTCDELDGFRRAGESMFYPHDEKLGIIAQDDSFLSKKLWNISSIPKENFPLLMHYHPLVINRHQVLKQADSVLANFIYREEDALTMMRSFRYYEQITTHDSSLSNCIYAIMAARLGNLDDAVKYFLRCVGTDTGDQNGNTRDGLHIANMGGVYRVLTAGFGGLRISEEGLSLFPLIPDVITALEFPVSYMGSLISVRADGKGCGVRLLRGEPLELTVYGQKYTADSSGTYIRRRMKAVIFDLDGVITDTAEFHYLAWQKLADELGIPFDREHNEQFKGVSRAQCLKLLLGWGGRTVSEEEFAALLEKKNRMYVELLDTLTPEHILPGIEDCLAALKANGVPHALFSVSKNTEYILKKLKMENAFSAKVTGFDIEHSKPHFEGYLKAAEKLCTDPRLCIMVEDSAAGISGAKALSMGTVAVMTENRAGADICVGDTSGIKDALFSLF